MAHSHILTGAGTEPYLPVIRRIKPGDIGAALRAGLADFAAAPTHAVFLCIIYPVVGLVLFRLVVGYDFLPLLFPLAAGFALIGPFAAVGLYELSRRRELGLDPYWTHAFDVFRSSAFPAIALLGLVLLVIFFCWLAVAQSIYVASFGQPPAASIPDFVNRIFNTPEGRYLIVVGNSVGFLFALLVLVISVVSFPLLLDRDVGIAVAVSTSVRAVALNPVPMLLWGLTVAVLLVLGSIPFFVGLTVVIPVLAHATWHLYRRVVEPGSAPRPQMKPRPEGERYAAQFPAVLLPWSRERR